MPNVLQKNDLLLPAAVTNRMFNMVRGKSALARLSDAEPMPFNGEQVFTFNFDKEVDLVAESGKKSNGGATIAPVTMSPVKIEYGVRVSDEFMFAADEIRLQYMMAFAEGFARKAARGLDIMAFHGVNPRTSSPADVLAGKFFDGVVTQKSILGSETATSAIEAAIQQVSGNEHEVTGLALSNVLRNSLAGEKKGTNSNEALYPELAWGAQPSTIQGLPADVNSTVSFANANALGYIGNFRDYFRWGYARQIPIRVIEYGNPDNDLDAGDLQGSNQVYLRGEAYLGWGILVPDAFSRIIAEDDDAQGGGDDNQGGDTP